MIMVNPWKKIKENIIYSNKWGFNLRDDDVITPAGKEGKYMVLEGGNNIIVIPQVKSGEYLLARQWRYPIQEESLEFVAEKSNLEEDIFTAAKRGLLEEIGGVSDDLTLLGSHWVFVGIMKIKSYVFLAKNVKIAQSEPDDTEQFEVEKCSLEEIREKIEKGEIKDVVCKIAYYMLKEHLDAKP